MSKTNESELAHRHRSSLNQGPNDHRGNVKYQDAHSRPPYPEFETTVGPTNLDILSGRAYEESDYSVEELRREFSPPGAGRNHRSRGDWNGTESHIRTYTVNRIPLYEDNKSDTDVRSISHSDHDSQRRRSSISVKRSKSRRRSLSRNEITLAAIGGAALAVGGKELWDRSKSERRPVQSKSLQTAAIGAAGALAAYEGAEIYAKKAARDDHESSRLHGSRSQKDDRHESHRSRERNYDKRHQSRSTHRPPPIDDRKYARKSISPDGLDSKSRTKSQDNATHLQKLAKTALLAGATEAFRVRKEPGGWTGDKGRRVLTAAIGASTIDAVADGGGKRHILEAVLGGLASNRMINGSRHQDDKQHRKPRNHSRSRSRGSRKDGTDHIADFVSTGLSTLVGKNTSGKPRSGARLRRSRSRSSSSSRHDDDRKKNERSKSVTDFVRKSLTALGLNDTPDHEGHHSTAPHHRSYRSESISDHSHFDHDDKRGKYSTKKDFEDYNFASTKGVGLRSRTEKYDGRHKHKNRRSSRTHDYSSRSSTDNERDKKR